VSAAATAALFSGYFRVITLDDVM